MSRKILTNILKQSKMLKKEDDKNAYPKIKKLQSRGLQVFIATFNLRLCHNVKRMHGPPL